MGQINHGKTTLLDSILKMDIASKEVGKERIDSRTHYAACVFI